MLNIAVVMLIRLSFLNGRFSMKLKRITAVAMAAVMSLCIFAAPASGLQAEAAPEYSRNWNNVRVYTANFSKSIASVNMQTPETSIKLFAGLSWEALESDISVRLNVSDSECGAEAMQAFHNLALYMGAHVVKILDMDLEKYTSKGWSQDITIVNSPIRVSMALPAGSDLTKDYAVISIRQDGGVEILGDLDADPATLTVDSSYFDTFAIVAANPGTFNAFRIASPYAVAPIWVSNYTKEVGTTVSAASNAYMLYDIGVVSDLATVRSAVGDQIVTLEVDDVEPGPNAKSTLQYALRQVPARRASYYEIELRNGRRERVTQTNQKLRITMTVPFDFPAYADYAVAVLNADGSVSILKDIDTNDSTITIDTDQFRTYAVIWGAKGAFALLP